MWHCFGEMPDSDGCWELQARFCLYWEKIKPMLSVFFLSFLLFILPFFLCTFLLWISSLPETIKSHIGFMRCKNGQYSCLCTELSTSSKGFCFCFLIDSGLFLYARICSYHHCLKNAESSQCFFWDGAPSSKGSFIVGFASYLLPPPGKLAFSSNSFDLWNFNSTDMQWYISSPYSTDHSNGQ